jgi:hypothetical protein
MRQMTVLRVNSCPPSLNTGVVEEIVTAGKEDIESKVHDGRRATNRSAKH